MNTNFHSQQTVSCLAYVDVPHLTGHSARSKAGVLNSRSSDVFCATRVHFSETYCVHLYDEKWFLDITEHILIT